MDAAHGHLPRRTTSWLFVLRRQPEDGHLGHLRHARIHDRVDKVSSGGSTDHGSPRPQIASRATAGPYTPVHQFLRRVWRASRRSRARATDRARLGHPRPQSRTWRSATPPVLGHRTWTTDQISTTAVAYGINGPDTDCRRPGASGTSALGHPQRLGGSRRPTTTRSARRQPVGTTSSSDAVFTTLTPTPVITTAVTARRSSAVNHADDRDGRVVDRSRVERARCCTGTTAVTAARRRSTRPTSPAHSQNLAGLTSSTTYHYAVSAAAPVGA